MTRASRVRWLALPIALSPATASAEPSPRAASGPSAEPPPVVRIETSRCPQLRAERIERLLRLELTTLVPVVSALPTLDVDMSCVEGLVRITLRDPVTVKVVTRDVSLGFSPDPERTLALAASELFLGSWAELLVARPEHDARPLAPAAVAAKEAVARVATAPLAAPSLAVDLRVVGRERHVVAPVLTLGGALRVGQARCGGLGVFTEAGWETGAASRPSGQVDVTAALAGGGARWCLRLANGQLGISASLSAAYVSLQGVSSSSAYYGAHHDGFTAEASGGFDASVTLRVVRLGAAVVGGALAPGPSGRVDGAAAVRLDGPWVGATLFAGLFL